MNVLVADDEPISRRLLEILLNKWGYNVTIASGGEEAWNLLKAKEHPRIAILDWMMPGMDGIQICQKLPRQEVDSRIYVLRLTAKQEKEDVERAFRAGADDYLAKPYGAQELRARLRAAGRILELEDQVRSAHKALEIETTHDPLTGLWNHSSILEILHRELHRARRQGTSLAVLMVEVNPLKEINHQYGHLAGDAALREASRRMRNSIRIYDFMGRYDSEQFIIISPACDRAGALSQAERLRLHTSRDPVETFMGAFPVTLRMGIAVGGDSQQPHLLISATDEALAEAKQHGGNTFEIAPA